MRKVFFEVANIKVFDTVCKICSNVARFMGFVDNLISNVRRSFANRLINSHAHLRGANGCIMRIHTRRLHKHDSHASAISSQFFFEARALSFCCGHFSIFVRTSLSLRCDNIQVSTEFGRFAQLFFLRQKAGFV